MRFFLSTAVNSRPVASAVSELPRNRYAVGAQREMEHLQDLALHLAVQVDQQVAARHQVQPRERRVAQDVVLGEQHLLAQRLHDAVAAGVLGGEATQQRRRDVGGHRFEVLAVAAARQRRFVDVGGEHLHRTQAFGAAVLAQQHQQAVRLLAGRAAGHPHAQRIVGFGFAQQRRHDMAFERFEGFRVAEEVGHADQHVAEQRTGFRRRARQELLVGLQVRQPVDLQPPLDAAQHGGTFVVLEVVAGARQQRGHDLPQRQLRRSRRIRRRRGHVGIRRRQLDALHVAPQLDQPRPDLVRRQHDVDLAGGDRGRGHAVELGVVDALRDDHAGLQLDVADAGRTVGTAAGQHHRHRALAVRVRERAEEQVDDDLAAAVALQRVQAQAAVDHRQPLARRDHVDVVGLDRRVLHHLRDFQARRALHDLRRAALVPRRQVHDDDEGHARRVRQAGEQPRQCADAAGRCADADHGEWQALGCRFCAHAPSLRPRISGRSRPQRRGRPGVAQGPMVGSLGMGIAAA